MTESLPWLEGLSETISKFPVAPCPYCKEECDADWVDVGVGYVQCGPYYCWNCRSSQIGPCDILPVDITPEEKKLGWYKPGRGCGSSANSVGGEPIDHKTALSLYEMESETGLKVRDEVRTILDPNLNVRKENEDCDR